MGVHDVDKYPEVKRLLGIPEDEPIFIIRGKDESAMEAITAYTAIADRLGASNEFLQGMGGVSIQFAAWRTDNRHKVKIPD